METGDSLLVGEFEAQPLSVVAQNFNVRQLEVHPSLVSACENLGTLSRSLCGGSTGLVAVQSDTKASQTDSHIDGGKGLALGGFGRVLAGALKSIGGQLIKPQSSYIKPGTLPNRTLTCLRG